MNKIATESVQMLADIAIIDPALTVSVPPMVTAATGVDAMAHCVEAFTSKRAHPIIDAYALQGHRAGRPLPRRAVEDGTDIEARAGLSLAAFYGGVCLGPVNTTAGHAIAYPLGTRHKLAHGIANALIFPHVLAANCPAVPEKTALVGRALGFGAEGRQAGARRARATSAPSLGLDMALRAHGVPHDDLPAVGEGGARDPAAARLEPSRPLRGRHPGNLRSGLLRPRREPMTKEAFVALVTCFNDDETVNYAATRAQVRRQVAAGNNIMCAGTNGDFTALTFEEKVRLCGEVVDEVGGQGPGHRQRRDARDLRDASCSAREFAKIGVDGIAVITPFFIAGDPGRACPPLLRRRRRSDDAGLSLRHPGAHPEPHRARDREGRSPLMATSPASRIPAARRRRSSSISRSAARFRASRSTLAPTTWCSGHSRTAPRGASPASATSCPTRSPASPAAFNAGDTAAAEAAQAAFGAFRKDLYTLGYPPALVKRSLYLMDNSVGASRQPALLPDPEQDKAIAALLAKHGLTAEVGA